MIVARDATEPALGVYFAELEPLLPVLEAEEARTPRLAADEIARAAALRCENERRLWRASHIALRMAIESWSGPAHRCVPYVLSPGGRPGLAAGDLFFSLSHSGGAALIAVSRAGAVGVDIEAVRQRTIPGGRRTQIEAFGKALAPDCALPAEGPRRFLQAWTRIEAAAKAQGGGVLKALRDAGVRGDGSLPRSVVHNFRVCDLDAGGGYCAAIARSELPARVVAARFAPLFA